MNRKAFILINILIFLRPHFDFIHPVLSVYLGDIIIFGIIILTLLQGKQVIDKKHEDLLYLTFFFLALLLVPVVINLYKVDSSLDILLDYIKILYYAILFWGLYLIYIKIDDKFNVINKVLEFSFMLIFIISMIQLFNMPILSKLIHSIYGTSKLRSIWTGYPRVYGTFYNANWFGVYLVFYLSWLNSNIIFKLIGFKKYMFKLILLSILFVVSGSRTALIGAFITFILQFISFEGKGKFNLITVGSLALIPTLIVINKIPMLQKTLDRFLSIIRIFKEYGFNISQLNPGRWESWMITYKRFLESPLVGSGKGEIISHNSYLYYLNMFGIIGVFIVILYIGSFKLLSNNYGKNLFIKKWERGFIVSFLVMALTAELFFTTQLMLLLVLMKVYRILPLKYY